MLLFMASENRALQSLQNTDDSDAPSRSFVMVVRSDEPRKKNVLDTTQSEATTKYSADTLCRPSQPLHRAIAMRSKSSPYEVWSISVLGGKYVGVNAGGGREVRRRSRSRSQAEKIAKNGSKDHSIRLIWVSRTLLPQQLLIHCTGASDMLCARRSRDPKLEAIHLRA